MANAQKNLNKAQRRGQRARDALAAVQADAAADADEVAECEQPVNSDRGVHSYTATARILIPAECSCNCMTGPSPLLEP